MRRVGLTALAVALLATACIGSVDRSDFEAEIDSRGGGFSQDLVIDSVAAVALHLGVADFEVTSMAVNPKSGTVNMVVRDPGAPSNLDTFTLTNGSIRSVEPVRLNAADNVDVAAFVITEVTLDQLDAMSDVALAEFDVAGDYITGMRIDSIPSIEPDVASQIQISFSLESPRSSATAEFTAAGELVEVRAQ
jgi:hypothetical protein